MVSERKRAANRANAKKSTGPRSARGKEKSSRNAIKHGLLCQRTPVLPFEDEFEYRAIADAMERDFAPVGIVQRHLVTQLIQINWKLRRVPAIEAALLEDSFRDISEEFERRKEEGEYDEDAVLEPVTAAKVIAGQFAMDGDRPYERLEMYGMRLQRSFTAACRELAKLKKETKGEELPVLNQFLYLKEDALRVQQKLDDMERAETADASSPSPGTPGEGGVRALREEDDATNRATVVSPHPTPLPAYREREQEGAAATVQVNQPNEPTAEGNSRPGRTLSRSEATANPLAQAAAATVKSLLPPKDWPKDKVWPYWEHFAKR